jgi:antitoxin CptB
MVRLYDTAPMSEPHSPPLDVRRRRLLFRATHRGTYENDLMLGGFLRAHMDTLKDADLTALEALLELPDPDLADWLTGRQPIPSEQDEPMVRGIWPMLHRIRAAVAR